MPEARRETFMVVAVVGALAPGGDPDFGDARLVPSATIRVTTASAEVEPAEAWSAAPDAPPLL